MSSDWFPAARTGVLAMANNWIAVCAGKRTAWGIAGVAQALIEDAGTRTAVAVAQCKEAFEAPGDCTRDFERRYFIKAPLSVEDLPRSAFAAKNPLELVFDERQRGKEVYFVLRGETGAVKKTGFPAGTSVPLVFLQSVFPSRRILCRQSVTKAIPRGRAHTRSFQNPTLAHWSNL
jgi:hypothetical protein